MSNKEREAASPFLEEKYVDELTGIAKGRDGQSKLQLQCAFLKKNGIPFIENARGRPILNRSYFEHTGRPKTVEPPEKKVWEPEMMKSGS